MLLDLQLDFLHALKSVRRLATNRTSKAMRTFLEGLVALVLLLQRHLGVDVRQLLLLLQELLRLERENNAPVKSERGTRGERGTVRR